MRQYRQVGKANYGEFQGEKTPHISDDAVEQDAAGGDIVWLRVVHFKCERTHFGSSTEQP